MNDVEHISKSWYAIRPVPRDGNCLFHSVAAQCTFNAIQLRHLTWNELQHQRYRDTIGTPPKNPYFSWMTTYGDVAPYALSRAIDQTFCVITDSCAYYIHPLGGKTGAPIYLYLKEGHYSIAEPHENMLLWEDQFY